MEVLELNINEKKDPFETVDRNKSLTSNLGDGYLHMRKKTTFANESLPERKEPPPPTGLQRRAKACTFPPYLMWSSELCIHSEKQMQNKVG